MEFWKISYLEKIFENTAFWHLSCTRIWQYVVVAVLWHHKWSKWRKFKILVTYNNCSYRHPALSLPPPTIPLNFHLIWLLELHFLCDTRTYCGELNMSLKPRRCLKKHSQSYCLDFFFVILTVSYICWKFCGCAKSKSESLIKDTKGNKI